MEFERSKDGTKIAYGRSGSGPAVIIVGGALSDRDGAADLAAALAASFTAIAYDRRGRGDSGDTQPYAVEREIEDIDALIAMAGGSAFVVGHSSGAVLSLRAAASGLAIPKLVVHEPPFIIDDQRAPQPEDYVERLESLVATGQPGDATTWFFTESVGVPSAAVDQMRGTPDWDAMVALEHTLPYDGRVMGDLMRGDPAPLRQFAQVKMPTLILTGDASPGFFRTAADALAAVLPDVEQATLSGQAHAAAADVMAPPVIEFLTR